MKKKQPPKPASQPILDYIHESLRSLALPLESLTPDPRNARKHGESNLAAIESSFTRWGVRKPIVVQRSAGQLIVRSGNGRVQVASGLGWTHLPAIVVDEGDDEAIAFALADNRTAELAEWDFSVLANTLEELATYDQPVVGWDDVQITKALVTAASALLDETNPKEPVIEGGIRPVKLAWKSDLVWESEDQLASWRKFVNMARRENPDVTIASAVLSWVQARL